MTEIVQTRQVRDALMMRLLRTLTAPLPDPLRRILSNTGGIDLLPLALLIGVQILMMILARISYSIFGV